MPVPWLDQKWKRETFVPRGRPNQETPESPRTTLQKLEQTDAPPGDPKTISELKRILLNRIANLELTQILDKSSDPATDKATDPADLVPQPSTVEEDHPDVFIRDTNLDKLE